MSKKLLWVGVAVLGAVAVGIIALKRGEPVNAMWLVIAALCVVGRGCGPCFNKMASKPRSENSRAVASSSRGTLVRRPSVEIASRRTWSRTS